MTTVDEVNSDKTKVPDEFIFCSVLLDCFTVIGMGGSWVVGRGSWVVGRGRKFGPDQA